MIPNESRARGRNWREGENLGHSHVSGRGPGYRDLSAVRFSGCSGGSTLASRLLLGERPTGTVGQAGPRPSRGEEVVAEEFAHVSGPHQTYIGQIERGEKNINWKPGQNIQHPRGDGSRAAVRAGNGRSNGWDLKARARTWCESRGGIPPRTEHSEAREATASSAQGDGSNNDVARRASGLARPALEAGAADCLYNKTDPDTLALCYMHQVQATISRPVLLAA